MKIIDKAIRILDSKRTLATESGYKLIEENSVYFIISPRGSIAEKTNREETAKRRFTELTGHKFW